MNPANIWYGSCRAYKARLTFVARLLKFVNFVCFKAILPYQANIQRDIKLEHYALGVVVHPNVTIGSNVKIYHNVTLAAETWVGSEHRIVVGDDVVIGAGAIVVARTDTSLYIGAGARIGAGAVVTRDVAAGQTVVGSPARPIYSIVDREEVSTH
jgi:serine O-acetyltransferase